MGSLAAARGPCDDAIVPVVSSDVIEVAARRLAAAIEQPARIILFGSYARGEAGPDSDLDFMVIERDVPNRHAEMARLTRELRSLRVPVDVLVVSEAYAEDWGGVVNTVVHATLTEGRELATTGPTAQQSASSSSASRTS